MRTIIALMLLCAGCGLLLEEGRTRSPESVSLDSSASPKPNEAPDANPGVDVAPVEVAPTPTRADWLAAQQLSAHFTLDNTPTGISPGCETVGAYTWVEGAASDAFAADSEAGYVRCIPAPTLRLLGSMTIAVWVRLQPIDPDETSVRSLVLFGAHGELESENVVYALAIRTQSTPPRLVWYQESGPGDPALTGSNNEYREIQAPEVLFDGSWHHLAVVRDAHTATDTATDTATVTWYVDAKLVGTQTLETMPTGGEAGGFYIGADGGRRDDYRPGARAALDEVYVLGSALSASVIATLMQPGAVP